jgi:type I restriction enzyme S subunit
MNGYSIINKKPSIVCLNQRLITKLGANYYSIRKIEMVEKIINSTEDNKALGSLVKTKEKRMKPKGKDSIYIGLANINSDTGEIEVNTVDEANIEGTSVIIEAGDILFSKLRPNLNKVAICPKYIGNALGSTEFVVMESKNIDKYFLYSVLKSNVALKQVIDITTGSTLPRIDSEDVLNILVPIPSPEIQKYIGDKVRRAEELREEAITLQKDIDILLDVDMLLEETDRINNIFHSKVNWTNEINIVDRIDPNFYQKKYRTTIEKLGDNKVELGELVKISKRRYQTGDINKYIEISSINNSFGTIDEVEELRPEEIPTSAKHQVKEGDILVSLVRPTRKAISIVTKEYDNAICTGGFAVLQSKGKVPVEFLTAVLRTNFAGIQFERYCTGSTYPTINENDVVKIFIPQYSEKQINKITEKYRRIIESIYRSKKLIQEAKQDVEDLIEGNFEMSELNKDSGTESRC